MSPYTAPGIANRIQSVEMPIKDKIDRIELITAATFGVTVSDIHTLSRKREIATARQTVMFLLRNNTDMTFLEIAKVYKRDHSTVIHSCNLILDFIAYDKEYREKLTGIKLKLGLK